MPEPRRPIVVRKKRSKFTDIKYLLHPKNWIPRKKKAKAEKKPEIE